MLDYFLFIVGLLLVWKGADFLIDGSAGIARRFGVRAFVIGLTVVSFGTSAPELVVNILAARRGASSLAIGNVMGSNVANLLLVLGLAAVLTRAAATPGGIPAGTPGRPWANGVTTQLSTVVWELPATIVGTLIVAGLLYLPITAGSLSRLDGLILLALFGVFLFYVYRLARTGPQRIPERTGPPAWRSIILVVVGVVALGLGAHWLVDKGLIIAERHGLTEGYVGFVLIAVGTSLPELAATVGAAVKGQNELAVGNVLGSNLFNLLFVLGITALVSPLAPGADTPLQIAPAAVAPLAVLILLLVAGRRLGRFIGALLVATYIGYLVWLAMHLRG